MVPALVQRRTDRRPPIDWPGRPTTVAGLLDALVGISPDAAEIAAAYRALAAELVPPPRPAAVRRKVPGVSRPAPRTTPRSSGPPPARRAAAELADRLARYAHSIPSVIGALRAIQGATEPPSAANAYPLLVPDHVTRTLIDAGTMRPATSPYFYWETDAPDPGAGPTVGWWPAPARPALDLGIPLQECTPALTDWRSPGLLAYAATMAQLESARGGYAAAARALAAAGRRRAERFQLTAQADRYRAWRTQFAVIADQVAADWAAAVQAARAALAVLTEQEGMSPTMPALTSSSGVVAEVAEQIRDRITQGQGGRIAAGQSEVAFGWSAGLPATLISYVASSQSTTRHIDVLRATDSGDPMTPVAEGGAKPDAVDFTSDDMDLAKYAGIATISTESANWVANVEQAVASVLISRLLRGIEADLVTALTADAGLTATGATMAAAVLDGIAKVAGAGGQAGVLALSALDWVTLMSESGTAGGYVNVGDAAAGPAPTWMGLATCIVPGLATGTALVLDPRSAVVVEAAGAPLFLVDLASQLRNNKIQVAAETWAAGYCANPGGVANVTVTAAP